ncbi:MAG TPA: polymer-forming cytoskeletal protein, partial [Stellaceae bacterium]|nr:polymer-forming cytoskeletal protein [Stellaceae bacterium]
MFARDKDTKAKNDDHIHETVTPLSEISVAASALPNNLDKPSTTTPITVRPVTPPIATREKADTKNENKKLIVGKGISLDGKISFCDRLVIDGKVEAELEDCHTVEVTENGTFKGAAEITGAEISGHYEGSLTVRESLLIRGT